jgi:DNA-binding CsgD family transcriptional regulator
MKGNTNQLPDPNQPQDQNELQPLSTAARLINSQLRQALFDFLYYNSPCGVGICDRSLRIVEVNPAWAAMDCKPIEAHTGKTVPEILGVDSCPVEEAMKEVFRTGEPIYKLKFAAKVPARQSLIHWTVNLIPIKNESGETTHVGSFTLTSVPRESYMIPFAHDFLQPEMGQNLKKLSPREIQIARLLADGKSNKEIGTALGISSHTVETHRKRVLKTLGVHSMAELVRVVMQAGLLKPSSKY